jgi:hypothetical protein
MVLSIQDQATCAFKRVNDLLESISISGCKLMELRGDYPRPSNWIEIGSGKVMMLCSAYISELSDEISHINVKYPWKDFSTNIDLSMREIHLMLLPWLEITEAKFCFLASKIETTEILNMPVLPHYKGRALPVLFGLAERDSLCLIYLIEEETETKTEDMNLKSFKLYVRTFGPEENLSKHLLERIIEWDKSGRPGINNFKVKAYFDKSNIIPSKNESLIRKKSVSLLFSWKKEQ